MRRPSRWRPPTDSPQSTAPCGNRSANAPASSPPTAACPPPWSTTPCAPTPTPSPLPCATIPTEPTPPGGSWPVPGTTFPQPGPTPCQAYCPTSSLPHRRPLRPARGQHLHRHRPHVGRHRSRHRRRVPVHRGDGSRPSPGSGRRITAHHSTRHRPVDKRGCLSSRPDPHVHRTPTRLAGDGASCSRGSRRGERPPHDSCRHLSRNGSSPSAPVPAVNRFHAAADAVAVLTRLTAADPATTPTLTLPPRGHRRPDRVPPSPAT